MTYEKMPLGTGQEVRLFQPKSEDLDSSPEEIQALADSILEDAFTSVEEVAGHEFLMYVDPMGQAIAVKLSRILPEADQVEISMNNQMTELLAVPFHRLAPHEPAMRKIANMMHGKMLTAAEIIELNNGIDAVNQQISPQ